MGSALCLLLGEEDGIAIEIELNMVGEGGIEIGRAIAVGMNLVLLLFYSRERNKGPARLTAVCSRIPRL